MEQSKRKKYLLKLTLLLISILTVMSAATIAPSLPLIASVFSATPNAEFLSKLLLSLPPIFIALSAPFAGKFVDRFGRLNLLYVGLVLYAISGTSGYFLNNIYYILGGRILLGISIGITMTIAITLIGDYFEGSERKKFIGFQGAFIALGGVIFISVGGFLADIGWRVPFLIYGLSLLLIPLVLLYLEEPLKTTSETKTTVASSNSKRLINIIFGTAIIFMILFFIIPTQLPFLLKTIGIEKHSLTGIALAVNAAGGVIGALLYSRLKNKISHSQVFAIGFFIMAIGFIGTGILQDFVLINICLFTAGFGFGLVLPNLNLWIILLAHEEFRGRNVGILTTCIFLGQFLSPLLVDPFTVFTDLPGIFIIASGCLISLSIGFVFLSKSELVAKPG